ncbi:MAG: ArsR family transcriptional regulator [Thermoplasmata archaeon]|nr:MAG: ArsR family transcriptional regulator [Thermoplasmata archaeon]HEC89145.1 transcriptional regulator [Thermoplasmatales archaeon]
MNIDSFFKCVVDTSRRRILTILMTGEKCVSEIVEETGLEQSLVSHHLKVLKTCGLVKSRQNGKKVLYSLPNPEIKDVFEAAEKVCIKMQDIEPHEECK